MNPDSATGQLIHSSIYSSRAYIDYLLNAGTVPGTGEISKNKADTVPALIELLTLWAEMGMKQSLL